jgi:alanine racemase
MPRPIRATISAGAIAHNLDVARRHAASAKVWAVIKANAYGHGVERAARAASAADGFAVLDFEEAARLRRAGFTQPILMLEGMFEPADVALVCQHRLTPVIHRRAQLEMLRTASAPLDVYLKVNSGMNRLGFNAANVQAGFQAL